MAENRIKWKPGEREQIAREVKRFNAKIEREAKKAAKDKNAQYIIPPKMKTADIKKMIKSRSDFNAFKKLVENAFKEGAFKQGKSGSTKYEQSEVKIRVGMINRARKRTMPEKQPGRQMGTERYNSFKPKKAKKLSNLGPHKEDYLESLRKESEWNYQDYINDLYVSNYMHAVEMNIQDPYKVQIIACLLRIPADAFITAKDTTEEFEIGYIYRNRFDTSLGYKILKAFEQLLSTLNIQHKEFYYEPWDVENDVGNSGFEPPED